MFQTAMAKDCFLKQPEMPCDVVKMPLSTSPTVKISGSFSFEEGGPGWERLGSNMGGSAAEGKQRFIEDLLTFSLVCYSKDEFS